MCCFYRISAARSSKPSLNSGRVCGGDQQLTLNEPFRDLRQELVGAWQASIRPSVRLSPAWGPCQQQQPQLPAQPGKFCLAPGSP